MTPGPEGDARGETGTDAVGRYDVIVAGAGPAGLSAALVLGRARRRVLVLDGGPPRNVHAPASHGFLTRDGASPAELVATARSEVARYPSVEMRAARLVAVEADAGGFAATLEGGAVERSRLLLLASGVRDVLPEVPGLTWGPRVHQCPHCHGWEVRDRALGLVGPARSMFERAAVLRAWSTDLTAFILDAHEAEPDAVERLRRLGVRVVTAAVARVEARPDALRVHLDGGDVIEVAALFVPATQEGPFDLALGLGALPVETATGFGPYLRANTSGETTARGVYAAGDVLGPPQSVAIAVGSGARAATNMHHALALMDAEAVLGGAGD